MFRERRLIRGRNDKKKKRKWKMFRNGMKEDVNIIKEDRRFRE